MNPEALIEKRQGLGVRIRSLGFVDIHKSLPQAPLRIVVVRHI